eukprot:7546173-Alexandrium_andersonii.AAC.1
MSATSMKLVAHLLHERPGGQSIGHGRQRAALIKARGGQDLVPLATGIPPEVCRRPGVPGVEIWGKVGE